MPELDRFEARQRLDQVHLAAERCWQDTEKLVLQAMEAPAADERLRLAYEAAAALVDYVDAADPDPKARPEQAAEAMAMTIVRIIAEARSTVGGGK